MATLTESRADRKARARRESVASELLAALKDAVLALELNGLSPTRNMFDTIAKAEGNSNRSQRVKPIDHELVGEPGSIHCSRCGASDVHEIAEACKSGASNEDGK